MEWQKPLETDGALKGGRRRGGGRGRRERALHFHHFPVLYISVSPGSFLPTAFIITIGMFPFSYNTDISPFPKPLACWCLDDTYNKHCNYMWLTSVVAR